MYTLTLNESKLLDRYTIIETAGTGGYSTVLHAYDTRLKREVAIKAFKIGKNASSEGDEESELPAILEARAAANLNSENIVTIYDCVQKGEEVYIIEEFVEGITLSTLLRILGDDIDLDIIAHIFKCLTNALLVAHKAKILHLDIKPDNILIGRGGEVKVADFGLATLMDINGEGTATAGTLGQMPPEQLNCQALDVRTDEWATALVLYEMLTGKNPFRKAKSIEKQRDLFKTEDLLVPSACWKNLPIEADDILFKALNVNPDNRYPSIKKFSDAIKPYLGEAKVGKKELSVLVNGNEDAFLDTSTSQISTQIENPAKHVEAKKPKGKKKEKKEESSSFLKGERFKKIAVRLLCAISSALLSAFTCVNFVEFANFYQFSFNYGGDLTLVIVVLATSLLSLFFPRWACFIPFAQISITLFLFQGWLPGTLIAVGFLFWWGYIGRTSNFISFCALLCPLAGAVFLSAISILAPSIMYKRFRGLRDVVLTILFCILCAFVFASFGSQSAIGWNPFSNFFLHSQIANMPTISANKIFLASVSDYTNWIFVGVCFIISLCISIFMKVRQRKANANGGKNNV